MTDFTIRKHIRCKDDGVNDYIEALENFIINLKAENTNRLIFKLDELNGVIADDVQKIIDGDTFEEMEVPSTDSEDGFIKVNVSKLKVLNDEKNSKVFERTMMLYGKLKELKETANVVKSMIPSVEEETKKGKMDIKGNVMEYVSNQIKNK